MLLLREADAGEVLTLQRAAYITEAQAHGDLDLPPLRQSLAELSAELADLDAFALGWRDGNGRLVAAVRARLADAAQSRAEIGRLPVAPDRQGQRLGTHLLAAVEAELPSGVPAWTNSGCSPASAAPATCGCTDNLATPRLPGSPPPLGTHSCT